MIWVSVTVRVKGDAISHSPSRSSFIFSHSCFKRYNDYDFLGRDLIVNCNPL
jgi:hypothetical protein